MATFAPVDIVGEEGLSTIAGLNSFGGRGSVAAVSVVFAANTRPDAAALNALAKASGQFSISLDPGVQDPDLSAWVELLTLGLTFDCTGIAPGPPALLPEKAHSFGLPADLDLSQAETITLVPGPHLVGGGTVFPVIRSLAWLGASLGQLAGALAVVWHGARSFNAPGHFRESVMRWIEGGAFPGLGLTALKGLENGGLGSEGLALFTGQEIELSPELAREPAEGAKLALRIIHWLVENGQIHQTSHLAGPSGEPLLLELVNDQRIIKVSKSF